MIAFLAYQLAEGLVGLAVGIAVVLGCLTLAVLFGLLYVLAAILLDIPESEEWDG